MPFMAHEEVCCQICGVSFNIGRYPTRSEATAGMPDARWLQNTQALRAQVVGSCGKDYYMGTLVEKPSGSFPRELVVESLKPISEIKRRRYTSDEQHIAGSACSKPGGYSGSSISAKEIRGCCTFQCLVPKPVSRRRLLMRPSPHGEQPKAEKYFYLSGISDLMLSQGYVHSTWPLDWGHSGLSVARNTFRNPDDAEKASMPFHPTCLEVFRRVSVYRWGTIDMLSLMDWYRVEAREEKYYREFPRHPLVRKAQRYWQDGRDQLWLHLAGSEFLAANPCFVPALPAILSSTVIDQNPHSKYPLISQAAPGQHQSSDLMSRLPMEIRLLLASFLDAADFKKLRLASRAFHELPRSFFRDFILREYPWLWEAWCNLPYAIFARSESWELRLAETIWKKRKSRLEKERLTLQEEMTSSGNPQHYLPKINSIRDQIAEGEAEFKKSCEPIPQELISDESNGVDWFSLYYRLSHNFDNLKGLQNRRRIWKDCEEILRRIEEHCAAGRMKAEGLRNHDELTH